MTNYPRPRRDLLRRVVAVLALLSLLTLAGCGSSASTSSESAAAAPAAGEQLNDSAAKVAGGYAATGTDSAATNTALSDAASAPRRVIRSGQLTVEVKDLAEAAAAVRAQASGLGGYVASETTGFGSSADPIYPDGKPVDGSIAPSAGRGQSVLVLRVPEKQLDAAFKQAAALGAVVSRSSTAQDVTGDIADLTSRTATAKASVERVRALLAKATSIAEIVTLESELTRREADLEAAQARLAAMSNQADLATLTVILQTSHADTSDDANGFVAGLNAGWRAMASSARALLVALGALLPFLLIGAPVAWLIRWFVRRTRRASAQPSAPRPEPEIRREPAGTASN